ncbi:MAG TPA: PAS domain-containing sensor histidine kinase, partial [Polyangiaceae bacterium]
MLDAVSEGVIGVDPRGVCVFANPAAASLLGYPSTEDLFGRDVRDITGSGNGVPGERSIDELCLEDEEAHVPETQLERADHSSFWAECWSHPIRREGRCVGAVLTFLDITERKRAAEERERLMHELEDAVRARDEFLAIAAHELRTPLTPLHLHAQGLIRALTRTPDGVTHAEILARVETMARQVGRLERLVEDLLDISRITSGKRMLLEVEALDLGAVVKELVVRSKDELARARCDVKIDAAGAVMGGWDRQRIEQILAHLLSNAMKFGAGKAIEIEVSAHPERNVARVEVRDHGIGIAPDDQRRVFERFERAVTSRHYGGFGLGLWIVQRTLEAMGG